MYAPPPQVLPCPLLVQVPSLKSSAGAPYADVPSLAGALTPDTAPGITGGVSPCIVLLPGPPHASTGVPGLAATVRLGGVQHVDAEVSGLGVSLSVVVVAGAGAVSGACSSLIACSYEGSWGSQERRASVRTAWGCVVLGLPCLRLTTHTFTKEWASYASKRQACVCVCVCVGGREVLLGRNKGQDTTCCEWTWSLYAGGILAAYWQVLPTRLPFFSLCPPPSCCHPIAGAPGSSALPLPMDLLVFPTTPDDVPSSARLLSAAWLSALPSVCALVGCGPGDARAVSGYLGVHRGVLGPLVAAMGKDVEAWS